jgi:hypothetical protein
VGGEQSGNGGPGEGPRTTYNIHARNLKLFVHFSIFSPFSLRRDIQQCNKPQTQHSPSPPWCPPGCVLSDSLEVHTGLCVDFRQITLEDIDLIREIRVDYVSGVVNHVQPVRRLIHCARIDGRKSDMTVAIYQGDHAEQVHRQPFILDNA